MTKNDLGSLAEHRRRTTFEQRQRATFDLWQSSGEEQLLISVKEAGKSDLRAVVKTNIRSPAEQQRSMTFDLYRAASKNDRECQ
ncbi:conserved hypothetical protein [Ricinus communis]|uniref:Uncharacterized protein n=1 Tax=Ricinus communis TaxID=3988 RepID=B9S6J9_RICCO|nr:conserved hypothetical protein [Ricinus communis]